MIKVHHIGYVVKSIEKWEKGLLGVNKLHQVFDPVQNAHLALYHQAGDLHIELIEPLSAEAFTWNALQKHGNHYHHICYRVASLAELEEVAVSNRLIHVLGPVPALLFDNALVAFYFNRNKEVVEFLINPS